MAELTKQDVREVVEEVLDRKLEPLATAIQRDFSEVKGELGGLKGELGEVKGELGGLREELGELKEDVVVIKNKVFVIESEILDIKNKLENVVYRHEFENVKDRITELERKVGIKKQ